LFLGSLTMNVAKPHQSQVPLVTMNMAKSHQSQVPPEQGKHCCRIVLIGWHEGISVQYFVIHSYVQYSISLILLLFFKCQTTFGKPRCRLLCITYAICHNVNICPLPVLLVSPDASCYTTHNDLYMMDSISRMNASSQIQISRFQGIWWVTSSWVVADAIQLCQTNGNMYRMIDSY